LLIPKKTLNFFQFLFIKALDPDWIRILIGVQPKMLDADPDPDEMNADPQSCRQRVGLEIRGTAR
jgi:hypothetical protein